MRRTPGRTKAARLAIVVVAVAAYVWALPAAFGGASSSSSSSYAYAYGKNKVLICHKGKTKKVPLPALAAHLAHGDTAGPCP